MPESSQLIATAVNARSITTKQGLLEHLFKLSFGGFVYNQIWEDPQVDAEAMQLDADSRIMTISSGGCNVLNYLAHGVASIDAVDLNDAPPPKPVICRRVRALAAPAPG